MDNTNYDMASDTRTRTPGDDLVTEIKPLLKSVYVKHDNLGGSPGCHGDNRQHVSEGLCQEEEQNKF